MALYEHHVLRCEPGSLAAAIATLDGDGRSAVAAAGGQVFGLWKALIGLSLNHLVVLTEWPDEATAKTNEGAVLAGLDRAVVGQHDVWLPTLRPAPGVVARRDPGFVTHRWYDIRDLDVERFLELSSATWSNWEGVHEGAVMGLWRTRLPPAPGLVRMRLMAWYRDMGVWERSRHWKGTRGAETANRNLGARYDLTLDSAVSILQPVA